MMGLLHFTMQKVERRAEPDSIKRNGLPDGGHVREGGDT
jgi:hypothetical protein